jgi:uncharacterized protein (DUF362 family)
VQAGRRGVIFAAPEQRRMGKRSKVAVLKTRPATVVEDVGRVMRMADWQSHLDRTATTILKDNISWHLNYPGANTTPWQLEGTIVEMQKAGWNELVCVQNRTVVTDAYKGERLNNYLPVLYRYGVPVRYNFEPRDMDWVVYRPNAEMLTLNDVYPAGIRIPDYFAGKNVVHLPTVKCHIYTTTTGAMKNAFGGLLPSNRHYCHPTIHETLVDLLAIQKEIHAGIFTVTDGTTAGNGPGPRTMIPVQKDLLLASSDCVAVDAVSSHLMGFDPMSLPYLRLAHERGLGTARIDEIDIVDEGVDVRKTNWGFSVGDNAASKVGDLLWFGPLKALNKIAFQTPLVYAFIFGSFIYHDYVWFPFGGGQKVLDEWRRTSPWGELFDSYSAASFVPWDRRLAAPAGS